MAALDGREERVKEPASASFSEAAAAAAAGSGWFVSCVAMPSTAAGSGSAVSSAGVAVVACEGAERPTDNAPPVLSPVPLPPSTASVGTVPACAFSTRTHTPAAVSHNRTVPSHEPLHNSSAA